MTSIVDCRCEVDVLANTQIQTLAMPTATVSLNIVETLKTCITAAICSQRYILNDVLRIQETLGNPSDGGIDISPDTPVSSSDGGGDAALVLEDSQRLQGSMQLSDEQQDKLRKSICQSLDVASKGELAHRATSTTDLVTSADVMVQHVVEAFLHSDFGRVVDTSQKLWLPFTVVGEEEDESVESMPEDVTTIIRNSNAVKGAFRYREALTQQEVQLLAAVDRHTTAHQWSSEDIEVTDKSWDALRRRVAIFIDPIDGTNAFVEGELHIPMTLIGIAVDGVPLAGVVNRVFLTDGSGAMNTGSLSIACRSARTAVRENSTVTHQPPFVVLGGKVVEDASRWPHTVQEDVDASAESEKILVVTYSASTKASILDPVLERLAPRQDVPARGAGYKIMMVVDSISGEAQVGTCADLFVSPNAAIKKWDSCAPHAILAALGGIAVDMHGLAITYPVVMSTEDGDGEMCREETISLCSGFVGMRSESIHLSVTKRFAW
jgi:inositol polyphosphate 1-phosphatase